VINVNAQLIETITRLVIEKMSAKQDVPSIPQLKEPPEEEPSGMVKIWNHLQNNSQVLTTVYSAADLSEDPSGMVKLRDHPAASKSSEVELISPDANDATLPELQTRLGIDDPLYKGELADLIRQTPARIGIGRAGLRPKTETWLRFRLDHAAAVDAVYGEVSEELLESLDLFSVHTLVTEKEEYIRRPDLGRRLSDEAIQIIRSRCIYEPKVQIIISDGLSSEAIEKNLEDVLLSFQQSLNNLGIAQGTPFYIEKGRVAVMDEVGELLQPEVVVLFIGERPGLLSAESLSAYLCYKPRKGTIEAERMVISNIHTGGIPPVEAGAYLGNVVQKVLQYKASGISLVQKEA
jgi:ethanolamine ammonia-lyase small subunit